MKALEYLACGWIPYVDNDAVIVYPEMLDIKKDEYFLTDNEMKKAIAQLENLIHNKKIRLNQDNITPVTTNSHDMSLVVFSDNYKVSNYSYTNSDNNDLSHSEIENVQIKFMKIERFDTPPSYIDWPSITFLTATEKCFYYTPVCIVNYGFSEFIYPDCNDIIKFSELEQYKEIKTENRGRHQIISDHDLFLCILKNIDKIFSKENNRKKEMRRPLMEALEKQHPDKQIAESTIKERIRPYLSALEGKYIEVHNK